MYGKPLEKPQPAAVEEFNRLEIDDDAARRRRWRAPIPVLTLSAFETSISPLRETTTLPFSDSIVIGTAKHHACSNASPERTRNRTTVPADVDSRLKSVGERPHDCSSRVLDHCGQGERRNLPKSRTSTTKSPLSLSNMSTRTSLGSMSTVGVLNRVRTRLADRKKERLLQRLFDPSCIQPPSHRSAKITQLFAPAPGTVDENGRWRRVKPHRQHRDVIVARFVYAESWRRAQRRHPRPGRSATVRAASASLRRPTSIGSFRRSTSPSEYSTSSDPGSSSADPWGRFGLIDAAERGRLCLIEPSDLTRW